MPVGRRTAMGTGRGWSRGAGRGWTMLPGASRPSTTAAGPTTVAAGSGCPARWWRSRYTLPRWWPSWADRALEKLSTGDDLCRLHVLLARREQRGLRLQDAIHETGWALEHLKTAV